MARQGWKSQGEGEQGVFFFLISESTNTFVLFFPFSMLFDHCVCVCVCGVCVCGVCVSRQLNNEQTTLFLYLLMQGTPNFANFVFSRSDIDQLVS